MMRVVMNHKIDRRLQWWRRPRTEGGGIMHASPISVRASKGLIGGRFLNRALMLELWKVS